MNKHTRVWSLQEAKAKFSEVVRLAQEVGPQTVTVHGRKAVTITAAAKIGGGKRKLTGKDFVAALRVGPKFDLDIPVRPRDSKFRDVEP
jgi:prevent-host-death family protein